MTRTKRFLTSLAASFFLLMSAFAIMAPAHAQSFTPGEPGSALDQAAAETTIGASGNDDQIFDTIGNLVNILLGLLGIIFFLITLYAGFLWMTAQGNGDQVTKARGMIVQGVIGMIIILSAFAISNFAISQLLAASQA